MEVSGYRQLLGSQHSSKYLLLCSTEERNSYRFGTTWGWENRWTVPLSWCSGEWCLCQCVMLLTGVCSRGHTWSRPCCYWPSRLRSIAPSSPAPQSPFRLSCCHGNWSRDTANYRKRRHRCWTGWARWETRVRRHWVTLQHEPV